MKNKPLDHQQQLMDALQFDEDDLEVNRQGKLSARQRKWLIMQNRSRLWWPLAPLLTAVVLFIALAPLFIGFNLVHTLLLFLFPTALGSLWWFSKRHDLSQPVQVIDGGIRLDVNTMNEATYVIAIGNERFIGNKRIFLAFKNGDPYTIYYLSRSKVIIAAEWLGSSPFES